MLIRLHDFVSVNPQNVAAVFTCGDMIITLRMANGHSHNLRCDHAGDCPAKFERIMRQLREHDDFYSVDAGRAVNVNHIISVAANPKGVVINMTGDFDAYIATRAKHETVARITGELEKFA